MQLSDDNNGHSSSASEAGESERRVQRELSLEEKLWSFLRGGRVEAQRFQRNQSIGGVTVALYCPAARLAVQLDGNRPGGLSDYASESETALTALGIRIVCVTADEIESDPRAVAARLRTLVSQRCASTGADGG